MKQASYITGLLCVCWVFTAGAGRANAQPDVEVCRKLQALAADQIREECAGCMATVECKWMPNSLINTGSGNIAGLRFDEPGLPRGYQIATVFSRGKETEKAQLYIKVEKELPVAGRKIGRGETVTADDLQRHMTDITRLPELPVNDEGEITGKAAGRMIRKGSVIFASDLQQPPLVKPGDAVEMVYREGGMEIMIQCTAREARAEGERIRLHSKETGKTYVGTVINSTKVMWEKTL